MDKRTQSKFARLWNAKVPLADIASQLGYSFQSLAKWRMILNLPKRYGGGDDGETPTPQVIRLRCLQQQTNWSETERRLRWRGPPHTIYESTSTCDFQP
jgi:transposase-like protein